ncbi:MAG: hypothetical protein HOM91_09040 [Tateyamaria sp.]|jgi:hypothetical protein|nr:hypothetical protein [Tateyamaria sp.]MBT5301375.1 hypothetical protein [Tateyamaria sp.]
MPRYVLTITVTLVILAAISGFRLGKRQITLDFTGVIEAVAEIHSASYGGLVGECYGWPGEGNSVFQVRCGTGLYSVDRLGRVEQMKEDGI